MTTTEYAAAIRSDLKRRYGWNGRQVSIRAEYFSLGSSINITVKDPAVPLSTVKTIAESAEHIRRCEVTGEILGGGNRYVSVRYSHEAQEIIGRRYADAVQRAVDSITPESPSLSIVDGTPFMVGRPHAHRITLWEDSYISDGGNVDQIANVIGNLMVAREPRR